MKLELLQLLSKTRVPHVPFVPSTETPANINISQRIDMEQIQSNDLFCLFHKAQNNEHRTNGTNPNSVLVPLRHEKKPSQNNALPGTEQTEHAEHVKKNDLIMLANLITRAGKLYHATDDEIADMQNHVLQFIDRDPENLNIALKGFKELAQSC